MVQVNLTHYSTKDFAKILGVSVMTVYAWEKRGVITPCKTITGKAYYTDEHIEIIRHWAENEKYKRK